MELALAAVVIVIGSYVQSSIGFGLAIISAPLLFIIDPLYVPGPVTVCALTLSLANTYLLVYRGYRLCWAVMTESCVCMYVCMYVCGLASFGGRACEH